MVKTQFKEQFLNRHLAIFWSFLFRKQLVVTEVIGLPSEKSLDTLRD